ncbi:response regulator transcription factor [Rhodococcus sp. MEB064]|uniref:response regulator transcription factor n=1 Tax=Rhodococcus sp. MEB064 TaxID=1587522 RepID=UPI0005ABF1E3|nr:LuxR C-terminal-related transcriptional regulator [Rhodococcus sp. MEB064]KIQ08006.1 hypothetical protein RU01_21570 [Rhodococcus sp. MEB064]
MSSIYALSPEWSLPARDVLYEVAHGKFNTEISRDLFITEASVKTHVFKLLGKLDPQDCGQLAIYVRRTNLL